MKKLIVLSVVFALVAAAAFAVDLGANVIGTSTLFQGDTAKDANDEATPVTTTANLNRVRLQGDAATEDGKFGGWIRVEGGMSGNAWWKPIDQVKLLIGSNGYDGFIGKEGVTGWMFQQTVYDTGVSWGGAGIWENNIYGSGLKYRDAFYEEGDGGNALYLFINPIDMIGINLILPVFDGRETADMFAKIIAQLDLKFGFGNIAVTYVGGLGSKDADNYVPGDDPDTYKDATVFTDAAGDKYYLAGGLPVKIKSDSGTAEVDDPGKIFLYYGGSFGDLSIDFGLGYKFAGKKGGESYNNPIGIGLGVKYATESFGIKFRTVVSIPGEDTDSMKILAEILPYIPLADKLTVFINAGLGLWMPPKDVDADAIVGWHFNPYLQVGEEWGAKFLVGFKLWSAGKPDADTDAVIKWAVPIAISVGF